MSKLVVKDNALIEASHKLSESEQRLILLAIVKGREFCDNIEHLRGKELEIHADDYMQAFGVERHAAYESLKKAVMGLYRAEWGYKYINDKGKTVVRYERFPNRLNTLRMGQRLNFGLLMPLFRCSLNWNATLLAMRLSKLLTYKVAMRCGCMSF